MSTGAQASAVTPLADPAATSVVPCDRLPWATLAPGFEIKLLRKGDGSGTYTVLTRLAPGIQVPRHRHHGDVHAWTISGCWRYAEYDWTARAGDYIYEPKASTHTLQIPESSQEPAVVLFVISQAQEYLDDAGNTLYVQDADFVEQIYRTTLAAQALEYPPDVLP